jgi:hypothetical protein
MHTSPQIQTFHNFLFQVNGMIVKLRNILFYSFDEPDLLLVGVLLSDVKIVKAFLYQALLDDIFS